MEQSLNLKCCAASGRNWLNSRVWRNACSLRSGKLSGQAAQLHRIDVRWLYRQERLPEGIKANLYD